MTKDEREAQAKLRHRQSACKSHVYSVTGEGGTCVMCEAPMPEWMMQVLG